jgi:hypothetical protein
MVGASYSCRAAGTYPLYVPAALCGGETVRLYGPVVRAGGALARRMGWRWGESAATAYSSGVAGRTSAGQVCQSTIYRVNSQEAAGDAPER